MASIPAEPTAAPGKQWFGHPPQLARLFATEAMERLGFYGMRVLLTLYLVDHFKFSDNVTGGLYGAFTSLVYLTPLIGGLVADRLIGSKKSVKLGALLMSIGYFTLCFGGEAARPFATIEGARLAVEQVKSGDTVTQYVAIAGERLKIAGREDGSVALERADGGVARLLPKGAVAASADRSPTYIAVLLFGLATVTIGNGFFKPNISTIVGALYATGDRRRDTGFTIFYLGINLGAFVSQLLCPILAVAFGYWAGFLFAAVGMLIGYLLFAFDGGRLDGFGEPPADTARDRTPLIALAAIAAIPLVYLLFDNTLASAEAARAAAASGGGFLSYLAGLPILGKIMLGTFLTSVIGIPIWAAAVGNRAEFQMMAVAIILVIFNVVFWTLFEQAGSSLTLFAERNVDRATMFGTLPAGSTQTFNSLFIIGLAPLFGLLWTALGRRGLEPGIPVKFAFALIGVGASFLVVVFGAGSVGADYKVALGWLVLLYFIASAAELCISPVGLSMITKLSIARVVGLMMGVWFLSIAIAQYAAGLIAQIAAVETVGGQVTNLKVSLDTYVGVFTTIGEVSIGIGIVLLLLSPLIKRWMHGVN